MVVCFTLVVVNPVFTQDFEYNGNQPSQDTVALEAVARLEKRYHTIGTFDALFVQETFSPGSLSPDSTGKGILVYRGPCNMAWKYEEPEAQVFVILPSVAWLYTIGDKQIQIFNPDSFHNSILGKTLRESIVKSFHIEGYTYVEEKGGKFLRISLSPHEKSSEIKRAILTIENTTGRIYRMETLDAVGRRNIITFTEEHVPGDRTLNALFNLPDDKNLIAVDENGQIISIDDVLMRIKRSAVNSDK